MSKPELLPILCFPDPRLHTVAKPVAAVALQIFVWEEQVPTTALWLLAAVAVPVVRLATETKTEVETVAV